MTRETLLLIALQSGALFLALWGIFRLIPSIPANAKAWMWRLAFLKPLLSLLPFAVVTLPVLPVAKQMPVALQGEESTSISVVSSAPIFTGSPVPFSESAPIAQAEVPAAVSAIDPLLAAWYVGVLVVAGYGLWGMYRSLKAVRLAQSVDRADLQLALGELLAKAQVHKPTRLLSSDHIQSAMLVGGRSYNILLPLEAVESGSFQDLRLMLAHEVAHIARRDLVWFGLTSAVQSIFFFNPMVWIAARCSRLDHESATDRHASQLAGVPVQTYAEMLLRATVVTRPSLAPGSLPVAESYRTIHRRLEAMKHFNTKPTFWRKTATAALAMLTLSLLPAYELAAAAYPDEFYPEEITFADQATTAPTVQITQVKQSKAAKATAKSSTITVPVKAVVGKGKKVRYYVWTKKGYVEVSAAAVQHRVISKGSVSVARPASATAKADPVKVANPALQPAKATKISNPIRAISVDPAMGQTTVDPARRDPSVAGTRVQGITSDPIRPAVATTVNLQTDPISRPATVHETTVNTQGKVEGASLTTVQGQTAFTTPGKVNVTTAYGALANGQRTTIAYESPLMKGAQGNRSASLAYGQQATLFGKSKALTTAQGKSLYGTPAQVQNRSLFETSRALTTTQGKSLYGTLARGQISTREALAASQALNKNSLGAYRTITTSQLSGNLQKDTLRKTWLVQGQKVQIVNSGDGKIKVIDANGATKVYELKKGAIYELEGGTLREVKPESAKATKAGASSFFNPSSSKYRYFVSGKDGTWMVAPSQGAAGAKWRSYAPAKGGTWQVFPLPGKKGEFKWIVGPDGKVKTVEPAKKSDPPAKSKNDEPAGEAIT